ncbi:SETD3 [Symbiodinium sp. CCMP2456]|nr:SETD3 [Symbiodinium sp. CCMP2456]
MGSEAEVCRLVRPEAPPAGSGFVVDFYWAAHAVCCRMLEMPKVLIRRRLQLLCRVAGPNRSNLCFPTFHLLGACVVPPDLMAMSALAVSGLGVCKGQGWGGEE